MSEHEKLFGNYWRQVFGPPSSSIHLLGKDLSVRSSNSFISLSLFIHGYVDPDSLPPLRVRVRYHGKAPDVWTRLRRSWVLSVSETSETWKNKL
jgi:hypothetical protein